MPPYFRLVSPPSPPPPPRLYLLWRWHWSYHVFALLISMLLEFSLMPRFKSVNFYQNNLKIKLFLQKNKIFWVLGLRSQTCIGFRQMRTKLRDPRNSPTPPQISGYQPYTEGFIIFITLLLNCSSFLVLGSYNEKLLSLPNNNRFHQKWIPLSWKTRVGTRQYNFLQPAIHYKGWPHKIPPLVSPSLGTPLYAPAYTSLESRTLF